VGCRATCTPRTSATVVDGVDRRFKDGSGVRRLDDDERDAVERAYLEYLDTVPESKRLGSIT